jgi:hypothetical protein
MGPQLVGKPYKYPFYLVAFLNSQFAKAVVAFQSFHRLKVNGLPRGTYVVHKPRHLAFVVGLKGHHKPVVSQGELLGICPGVLGGCSHNAA